MTRREFVMAWKHNPISKIRCFYCGREFRKGAGCSKSIYRETVEHIVPQHSYKGGPQVLHNTVGACAGCNNGKNGDSPRDFRTWFGKPFFCESWLGETYPIDDNSVQGDGTQRLYYGGMVDTWHKQNMSIIEEHFEGKRLKILLKKIIWEARHGRKNIR